MIRYVCDTRAEQYIAKVNFNPTYPPCTAGNPPGCSSIPLAEHRSKPLFRAALKASLIKEGFRNPILGYTCEDGLLLKFGNSRLQLARELDIDLPAIIVDHLGRYDDRPEVTMANFEEFFTDVPKVFHINKDGTLDHSYNLGRANQHKYDPKGLEWLGDDPTGAISEFSQIDRAAYLQHRLRRSTSERDQGKDYPEPELWGSDA